jgi:hypothetical protein
MTRYSIGAFIALPHLLDRYHPHAGFHIEQHAVVSHAQAVVVGVVFQAPNVQDALAFGLIAQFAHGSDNAIAIRLGDFPRLPHRAYAPLHSIDHKFL